ncbi:PGPGW domain-containing protein [Nocardioides cavernaquae]|uniref:PGPGW domain-containing protein n=1 Tax=Nocardioides cavernaquae TaxID=2321396 RepID=UPI0016001A68|nr:PGPGW domain-containing protein [Nocardioides cavernaquae]
MTTEERPPETEPRPNAAKRLHTRLHANPVTGLATKVVVTVIGVAIVLAGAVMTGPVPGPGFLIVVAGLAILATEWAWAEKLLQRARAWLEKSTAQVKNMDPAVRRRRLLLGLLATVLVLGVAAALIAAYGWPGLAISSWDRIQSISDVVPELPGM